MSAPANSTRPASGRTVPVAMPNSVVLPAPFGPMMPSASPSASARSIRSATTTAPKRFEIFSSARMGMGRCFLLTSPRVLPQQRQRAADGDFRRGLVRRDDELEVVALALPLAGDQRRLRHVLHR